eukprot:gene7322-12907_t
MRADLPGWVPPGKCLIVLTTDVVQAYDELEHSLL